MADYVNLIGVEEVSRAASRMAQAADQMTRAAATIDEALRSHQMFLEDWLSRWQAAHATVENDIEWPVESTDLASRIGVRPTPPRPSEPFKKG